MAARPRLLHVASFRPPYMRFVRVFERDASRALRQLPFVRRSAPLPGYGKTARIRVVRVKWTSPTEA